MDIFSEHFGALQDAILLTEHHEHLGTKCQCGADTTVFRCEDCFHLHLFCQTCILDSHLHNPFHHIEKWTGTYFKRTSLATLGGTIPLCHHGELCPNRLNSPGRPTVIVHMNGIHHVHIKYCHCATAPLDAIQLVWCQLFPASIEQPETAFTINVLRDFHVHSLASKQSAMDHFTALQNHTNKAFPQKTPDRYWEFVCVVRVWCHLTTVCCSGQFHNIDELAPHRRPGSLTVRCLSCPEIGFNVDKETIDNTDKSERFVAHQSSM
jgi:hypothetical protein